MGILGLDRERAMQHFETLKQTKLGSKNWQQQQHCGNNEYSLSPGMHGIGASAKMRRRTMKPSACIYQIHFIIRICSAPDNAVVRVP